MAKKLKWNLILMSVLYPVSYTHLITVRLFIRKPMYTRQITGRKPMQVSWWAAI